MPRTVGDMGRPATRGEPLERVMRYIQYDTNGGCWLWDSGITFNGHSHYPIFTLRPGKQERVNRFMYRTHNGPIMRNEIVRHTCDVTLCVNPAHLIVGTHKDNAQDRETRGRSRWAVHGVASHCRYGHPMSGENLRIYGGRRACRECRNERGRQRRARAAATARETTT